MSTFAAPVRVRGPIENDDSGPAVDAGDVIVSQTNTLTFPEVTKNFFFLPANSQIIGINVDVTVAFDAGTTNTLDVGTAATPELFADDLNVGAVARVLGSSDGSQLVNYADTGNTRIQVQGVYAETGTAATVGTAQVTVLYSVKQTLPA